MCHLAVNIIEFVCNFTFRKTLEFVMKTACFFTTEVHKNPISGDGQDANKRFEEWESG